MLNSDKFSEANKHFSKAQSLSAVHADYNSQYIFSLVADGKIDSANKLIARLDPSQKETFLFQFIEGVHLINNRNYFLAKKKFKSIKTNNVLFKELKNYVQLWLNVSLSNETDQEKKINSFETSFPNIKLIQSLLLYGHVQNNDLYLKASKEILSKNQLGRYHFFHVIYLVEKNKIDEAKRVIENQLKINPNNLLTKQSYMALTDNNLSFFKGSYESININHGISELLYLFSNLFQQQDRTNLSKLFFSLSNYLNPSFISNKLLIFENQLISKQSLGFDEKLSQSISNLGGEFYWYVNFNKLSFDKNNLTEKNEPVLKNLIKYLSENKYFHFSKLMNMGDYYRSIKDYNQAISYYDQAEKYASQKDLDWRFYYSRGICKERLKQWSLADKDFILALKQSPKEYRVMNYMAYSWLERGIYYNKALQLLEEAVDVSKWEYGYVIDSLGWAHYLLNNFGKAESLLELAYTKAPNEAEVYDHYGDVLWKNNKKIQAKYVWSNALKLQSLEKDRKVKIKEKILNGIN
tara:strand:+ start:1 stop:1566 length:1566 start_codon:yes stop_codon:yes gene_type:complete